MRLRPRRLRPQTGVAILVLVFVLSVLIWGLWELWRWMRTHWTRALVGYSSGLSLLLFAVGWITR